MADAGFSADIKLFKKLMYDEVLIKIHKDDDAIAVLIKTKMNKVLATDVVTKCTGYAGNKSYTYYNHTAWGDMYNMLVKINQIREKNWYFEPLKL